MIKEAIEKIQSLTFEGMQPEEISIGGKTFIVHNGKTFSDEPSIPAPLDFTTLSGLEQYIRGNFDSAFITGKKIVHVCSPKRVEFYGEAVQPYAKRCVLAIVKPATPEEFPFGRFMSGEEFMIAIQSRFAQHVGDWDDVVAACAGIKKQDGTEYKDSGVAQTVTVQAGLSLAATKKLPNPVELAPFRTFPEINQPLSKFVLRVTDGKFGPELGLFEADGGAWKPDAIRSIGQWLEFALEGTGVTIIS